MPDFFEQGSDEGEGPVGSPKDEDDNEQEEFDRMHSIDTPGHSLFNPFRGTPWDISSSLEID